MLVTETDLTNEVQFNSEADYQSAAKFGASLIKYNWRGGQDIETFGSDGDTVRVDQRTGELSFRAVQFRESADDETGSVDDSNIKFDGITCEETNQSLYIEKNRDKVQFDIETFRETPTLTFELWMRGRNPFTSTGFIFSMSLIDDRDRFFDTLMAVDVESN